MPQTLWTLPNFSGELFTADMINTPVFTMIGGLTNGGLQTANFQFPTSSNYAFPGAAQPNITEDASITAPATTAAVRTQVDNVAQIFHQAVRVTYEKLSNSGRLQGINTAGQSNNVADELAFQIGYNLKIIARNIENTILNGVYNLSTASDVANRSRGLIATTLLGGSTRIDATGDPLSRDLMQTLFRTMFGNGAMFQTPVIMVNGLQKQRLSDIYGFAPTDRNVGGINIQQIETDFGLIGVAPAHRFMPNDGLLLADMSVVAPVFQPVPDKGNFFYEELAKTGAVESGQIYGKFGLDHGPAFAHGYLTDLAV